MVSERYAQKCMVFKRFSQFFSDIGVPLCAQMHIIILQCLYFSHDPLAPRALSTIVAAITEFSTQVSFISTDFWSDFCTRKGLIHGSIATGELNGA